VIVLDNKEQSPKTPEKITLLEHTPSHKCHHWHL